MGGPRSYYTFELFLETRKPGEEFEVYNKGGLNLKVHVINLPEETVRDAVQLRGEHGWTLRHFKDVLGKVRVVERERERQKVASYFMTWWYLRCFLWTRSSCVLPWKHTRVRESI